MSDTAVKKIENEDVRVLDGREHRPTQNKSSRRNFLKLMGATAVMITAACRRPTERIIPAVIRAPETSPGISNYYTTVSPDGIPLIVKTRDGRPLKISGNPDFPLYQGGVSAYHLADLMDLYDPDRLKKPKKRNDKLQLKESPMAVGLQKVKEKIQKGKYVLLSGPVCSPTTRSLIQTFLTSNPGGKHLAWNPDSTIRRLGDGEKICYGKKASLPLWRFDRAKIIVSIDGDFLGAMPRTEMYSRLFAKSRSVNPKKKTMCHLIAFESMMTVTGSNADNRYPILPNQQLLVVLALLAYFSQGTYKKLSKDLRLFLEPFHPTKIQNWVHPDISKKSIFQPKRFTQIIQKTCDLLWQEQGHSLIMGGGPQHENGMATATQVGINLLNSYLGNDGQTIQYEQSLAPDSGSQEFAGAGLEEMQKLTRELEQGKVESLIVLGVNPVYHLPTQVKFHEAIQKVPYVCAVSSHLDETSSMSDDVFPLSHYTESWNYYQPVQGIHAIAQPLIRPLQNSLSVEDFLMQVSPASLGSAKNYYEIIRQRVGEVLLKKNLSTAGTKDQDLHSASLKQWGKMLQRGFFADKSQLAAKAVARPINTAQSIRSLKQAASQIISVSHIANQGQGEIDATKNSDANESTNRMMAPTKENQMQLGFYYNVQVRHGEWSNNTLRQELPEPITKIVWDNYAALLPETARKLGIRQGDILEVRPLSSKTKKETVMKIPAHLQPGLHPKTMMIAHGYGRTKGGKITKGVGTSTKSFVSLHSQQTGEIQAIVVKIRNTKKSYPLASTQAIYRTGLNTESKATFAPEKLLNAKYSGSSQYDRPLLRETTWQEYSSGDFSLEPAAVKYPKGQELVPSWKYDKHKWHMVIDLNSCTGCGACVTSCNTENNIPMVGREQVSLGREMHWIRIDRYFSGNEKEPEVAHQPMLCQHCENAPCETVCPVAATTHNSEGLNTMTYNRCIGTRYCANNCPYKVRRFNYYEYWDFWEGFQKKLRNPQQLGLNPDVTVRSRGVVEKCTFCIQRIQRARQDVRSKGKEFIEDGIIQTACQEVCPTSAISFGNILDSEGKVRQQLDAEKKRSYHVLEYLNVKPSISYLGKVRNQPLNKIK